MVCVAQHVPTSHLHCNTLRVVSPRRPCCAVRLLTTSGHKVSLSWSPSAPNFAARPLYIRRHCCRAEAVQEATPKANASAPPQDAEKKTPFVDEMRVKAMKLHTRSQAKEGEQKDTEKPLGKWEPSKQGYIQFLTDSKHVYEVMEALMKEASQPIYKEFVDTGLERTQALQKDLQWFASQGHSLPQPGPAGTEYAEYLKELAHSNPPAFICHFYNVYFAHSAGGRMIGKKVAESILDGAELEFYKWEGELQELLQGVRDKLNHVAESWSREEKDVCLEETSKSFAKSGAIMKSIFA